MEPFPSALPVPGARGSGEEVEAQDRSPGQGAAPGIKQPSRKAASRRGMASLCTVAEIQAAFMAIPGLPA